jgi:hypothetical protein
MSHLTTEEKKEAEDNSKEEEITNVMHVGTLEGMSMGQVIDGRCATNGGVFDVRLSPPVSCMCCVHVHARCTSACTSEVIGTVVVHVAPVSV